MIRFRVRSYLGGFKRSIMKIVSSFFLVVFLHLSVSMCSFVVEAALVLVFFFLGINLGGGISFESVARSFNEFLLLRECDFDVCPKSFVEILGVEHYIRLTMT